MEALSRPERSAPLTEASTGLHWTLSLAGTAVRVRLLRYRSLEKKADQLYGTMTKSTHYARMVDDDLLTAYQEHGLMDKFLRG